MITRFEQFSAAISTIYQSMAKIERMEMAKYGLKGPHAQCLLAMKRHPEGITAARICEVCEKDKAAVSRILSELEAAGMVVRENRNGSPSGFLFPVQIPSTSRSLEMFPSNRYPSIPHSRPAAIFLSRSSTK